VGTFSLQIQLFFAVNICDLYAVLDIGGGI
jgi:hypothetical protein